MIIKTPTNAFEAQELLNKIHSAGGIRPLSREIGCDSGGLSRKAKKAREILDNTPLDVTLKNKVKVRVKAPIRRTDTTNVLVIADFHDSPKLDKIRAKWIGRHIASTKPDRVVIIGDFADFESLCSHVRNDTYYGKLKPSFQEDLASMKVALQEMFNEFKDVCNPRFDITLGNHEYRMWSFENNNPEIFGFMRHAFMEVLSEFNIVPHEYGQYLMIDGVGFTHIPFNAMGKPYGGQNATMNAGRDSVHDLVFGHTHKFGVYSKPKLNGHVIKIVDVGTSLPYGHVEEYAKHSMTGWSWGITELRLNGRIEDVNFISMRQLEEQYE